MEIRNKIFQGNSVEVLRTLPAESMDLCVTSPPYYALRSYNTEPQVWGGDLNCNHVWSSVKGFDRCERCNNCGAIKCELGQEITPDLYVDHLVQIFSEVKRVLKPDGSLYINISDTYSSSTKGDNRKPEEFTGTVGALQSGAQSAGGSFKVDTGVPSKCLVGIPERFMLKMIDDGWLLRSKIIWEKVNAMPDSVRDRFSNRWEVIYFFVKNQRYFFDLDAIKVPYKMESIERAKRGSSLTHKYADTNGSMGSSNLQKPRLPEKMVNLLGELDPEIVESVMKKMPPIGGKKKAGGDNPKYSGNTPNWQQGKNPGNVWEISTQALKESHYAAFPINLLTMPITASCPAEICTKCGKPKYKTSKSKIDLTGLKEETKVDDLNVGAGGEKFRRNYLNIPGYQKRLKEKETIVSEVKCDCNVDYLPGVVLDPFFGSGTVGIASLILGRNFVGIELNPEYIKLAEKRIDKEAGLLLYASKREKCTP